MEILQPGIEVLESFPRGHWGHWGALGTAERCYDTYPERRLIKPFDEAPARCRMSDAAMRR